MIAETMCEEKILEKIVFLVAKLMASSMILPLCEGDCCEETGVEEKRAELF